MFESGEGAGTTTQSISLCKSLRKEGHKCIWTREPGGTKESNQIRKILLHKENKLHPLTELFLYEGARVESSLRVNYYRDKGFNIIKDRCWPSTDAYQGAAGKVDINLIRQLNEIATFEIKPDLLVIIDGEPEKLLKKETSPDRFSAKGLEYHQKVREGYLDILVRYPEFAVKINYREGDIRGMQEEIYDHVRKILD